MIASIIMILSIGPSIGIVINHNFCELFAPSSDALSYTSFGMACNPARNKSK
ncbi:hypothetical protein D3C72_2380740 [compost metagenome]